MPGMVLAPVAAMRLRILGPTLIVAIGMMSAQSSAHFQQSQAQKQLLSKDDATTVMRMLLTIQTNRPFGKEHFGLLEEVLKGVHLPGQEPVRIDSHTATYRGYTIRMMRSTTRQHFSLTLVPSDGFCAASYFANENNIIYIGQAVGCPAE